MSPPPAVDVPPHPVPVGPSLERWREMSSDERARFIDSVNDALSQPALAMTEGRPHRLAKSRTLDVLGLHFGAIGRTIYLADELAVIYPGEPGFSPDILAVLDVPQIENDERMAWVVADEGKGIDLAIEVLHAGDRKKDLVDNVERYARLGIPEYFVYDRARQQIVGYRLGERARYERIVPQGGRVRSAVLALDLAIQGGSLRFFHGTAELFGTSDLVLRLSGMVEDLVHFLFRAGSPAISPVPAPVSADDKTRGAALYRDVGCLACHGETPPAHPHRKYRPGELAAFLLDPLRARPGGRMPSSRLTAAEAGDISSAPPASITVCLPWLMFS